MPGDTNKDGKLTLGEAFFNMREFIQEIWRDNWTEGSQQTRISGSWEFVLFER